MTTAQAPVLVVGGRTTGLMMAAELARHGVPVRIIDKSPGIDPHSRATFLHSRTQEILHSLGIVDEFLETAQPMRGIRYFANCKYAGRSREDEADSPFPVGVGLSQAKIEAILERHLNRFGVQVERNTQLTALEQTPVSVRATVLHADGREEVIDTPWLIGCDGAHSTVRHLTEEVFPGQADPFAYMLADVIVDAPLDPDDAYVFLSDYGDLFFFVLDEGRRFVVANSPKHSDSCEAPTLEQMQQMVNERSFGEYRLSDPRWLAHFHIHYRLAPHYRHGRTFLAGDAAHVHSLIGGQGMNTGIQDAHNLAWKLALVIGGVAPISWLATYEKERRGVAEDVIRLTRGMTEDAESFVDLSPAERHKLVAHMFLPESEKAKARQHAEELDLDYSSSPICLEPEEGFVGGPHCGCRAPDATPLVVAGKTCSFFDLLCSPQHKLVLFAPASAEQVPEEIIAAANAALENHGQWIDVFVVTSSTMSQALPENVTHIEDRQQTLLTRYTAEDGALYLIRPDGYIAYRSRQFDGLSSFCERVLS